MDAEIERHMVKVYERYEAVDEVKQVDMIEFIGLEAAYPNGKIDQMHIECHLFDFKNNQRALLKRDPDYVVSYDGPMKVAAFGIMANGRSWVRFHSPIKFSDFMVGMELAICRQ